MSNGMKAIKFGLLVLLLTSWHSSPVQPRAKGETDPRTPQALVLEESLPGVWEIVHDALSKLGYDIDSEDKGEGRVSTLEDDGITGAAALPTLKKIAVVAADQVSYFNEARYTIEVRIAFLQPKKTAVSVFATITGKKRDSSGKENWVTLPSNGVMERRVLNEISFAATGKRPYKDDLPYWKKGSQHITIKE